MKLAATTHLAVLLLVASTLAWLGPAQSAPLASLLQGPSDHVPFVATGTRIESVPVEGDPRNGELATWSPAETQATLLLVFSKGCPNCDRIVASWRELIGFLRPPDSGPLPIDVVLLSTSPEDDAREYVARHALDARLIVADLDAAADERGRERLAPFGSVPQTVLIEPDGTVSRSRVGPLERDEVSAWIQALMDMVEVVAARW